MSKLRAKSLFHLVAILGVTWVLMGNDACNNDDVPVGTMEAVVDGVQWSAANANSNDLGDTMGFSTIVITGATVTSDVMNISLIGIEEEGIYTFEDDDAPAVTASFTDNGDIGETFGAETGTLEITYYGDDRVAGTFDFEGILADGTTTVSVTQGAFNVEWGLFPGL